MKLSYTGLAVLLGAQAALSAQEASLATVPAPQPGQVTQAALIRSSSFSATLPQSAQQAHKPAAQASTAPPPPMKRRQIDPSMVGYLDDSAVGNEVRLRFDAGFNMPRPDRAEYFYAGSSTPSPATSAVQRTLNFQELYLSGEYAPFKYFSAFVMVPYRWIEPFFISSPGKSPDLFSGGGISDVQAALKFAALHTDSTQVTLELRASFPSGNGANGFGTNHYTVEPMVLMYRRLSDRAALEAEAGDSHPIGGTIFVNPPSPSQKWSADVAMYGLGPSYRLITRDKYSFAPVLELVTWHVFGGLQTGQDNLVQSAAGINVFNAKLGGRINFSNGSSIYAGYGRGITSDIWYRNLFRIEYRRSF